MIIKLWTSKERHCPWGRTQ